MLKKLFSLPSFFLSFFLGIILISCDKVEYPYEHLEDVIIGTQGRTDTTFSDTSQQIMKIFLEDYTGVQCGNCPRAGREAKMIYEKHPEHIILAQVHTGSLARTDDKHPKDFRTPAGDAFEQIFGPTTPYGTINRIFNNNNQNISMPLWDNIITDLLADPLYMTPKFDLKIRAIYNEESRYLQIKSDITSLNANNSDDYNLTVYILEDSIVAPQTDYSIATPENPVTLVPDYIHMFVLRSSLVSPWGVTLKEGGFALSESESIVLETNLNSEWDENLCSIVVYISNQNREIIHVDNIHRFYKK